MMVVTPSRFTMERKPSRRDARTCTPRQRAGQTTFKDNGQSRQRTGMITTQAAREGGSHETKRCTEQFGLDTAADYAHTQRAQQQQQQDSPAPGAAAGRTIINPSFLPSRPHPGR